MLSKMQESICYNGLEWIGSFHRKTTVCAAVALVNESAALIKKMELVLVVKTTTTTTDVRLSGTCRK